MYEGKVKHGDGNIYNPLSMCVYDEVIPNSCSIDQSVLYYYLSLYNITSNIDCDEL